MKEENCSFRFIMGLLVATGILVGLDHCAPIVGVREHEIAVQDYLMHPENYTVKKVYEDTIFINYKVTYNGKK